MTMPADPVVSLPSGLIDRLLRTAVAAPQEVAGEPAGRLAARLLLELADRDEDLLLNTYLARRPSRPPKFAVWVGRPDAAEPDDLIEGLDVARAIRAANARVGVPDTLVEVIAREPEGRDRVMFRAGPGEALTFLLPDVDSDDPWARRLQGWASSMDDDVLDLNLDAGLLPADIASRRGAIGPPSEPTTSTEAVAVHVPRANTDDIRAAVHDAMANLALQVEADDLSATIVEAVGHALDQRESSGVAAAPSAREIADAIAKALPTASAIAAEVRRTLPSPPTVPKVPTAAEVAAELRVLLGDDVVPKVPTAGEVAAVVAAALPTPPSSSEIADLVVARLPHTPTEADVRAAVAAAVPDPPSATEIASKVLERIPVPPTPEELADAVSARLPRSAFDDRRDPPAPAPAVEPHALAAAVVKALPAAPSADEIVQRLGEIGFELDAAAIGPALASAVPSADELARLLTPELARGWARVERHVLEVLSGVPNGADLELFRGEADKLAELLRSVRLVFSTLNDEIVGSARRSREQIDQLARELSDDLHRLGRRFDDAGARVAGHYARVRDDAGDELGEGVTPPA